MKLYDQFLVAISDAQEVGGNIPISLLSKHVEEIEDSATDDIALSDYKDKLIALLSNNDFALKPNLVNEFVQMLGEAHFYVLCKSKGIFLDRVKEQKTNKTPDFRLSCDTVDAYFEVKTPSMVFGKEGIENTLESSLDAQIDIDGQRKLGKQVSIGVSESRPYHTKPDERGNLRGIIETLIEKARQSIKQEQYSNPNTFLVMNFCMLPPSTTDNRGLRPAYCDDYMFSKALTGDLWMLAFAKPGMMVHGCPEFEGEPCIEGILEKYGILEDEEYKIIAGLIFVVYSLSGDPQIFGLFRHEDIERWSIKEELVWTELNKLVGDNWNDENDSYGYRLQG